VTRNQVRLFDLVADPFEQHDVAPEHPDVIARLGRRLGGFLERGETRDR
jgi:hypothetical protein